MDLGSGSGRAVLAGALGGGFDRAVGVELLPSLHDIALQAKNLYNLNTKSECRVELVLGSFLDISTVFDWTKADIVFINSTAFDVDMFKKIEAIARDSDMRRGSYMVTLTQNFTRQSGFRVIQELRLEMSWGEADIFVHVKS